MSRRTISASLAGRFLGEFGGASAVEFAMVAAPLIYVFLGVLQIGIFYMAQSALDTGIVRTADNLRNAFATGASPTLPSAATLKANVAANSGSMISGGGSLAVEIRQLAALDAAVLPVADGTTDYGSTTSTLVLRAQASVVTFAPGFSGLARARSSAIVRRMGR